MGSKWRKDSWRLTKEQDYAWRGPSLIDAGAIYIRVSNAVSKAIQTVTEQIWVEVRGHIGDVWQGNWYE